MRLKVDSLEIWNRYPERLISIFQTPVRRVLAPFDFRKLAHAVLLEISLPIAIDLKPQG